MADKSLIMSFLTDEGKKSSLRLNGVRDDITEAEVSAAMDVVISSNIFFTSSGELKIKDSAQIVETNVASLDVR
jgi:hypothetical protein